MANGIADMGDLELDLDRDIFLRGLMHELAGALEIFVGLPEAAGFISGAGAAVGREVNRRYKTALRVSRLSVEQVGDVIVDFKRRVEGEYFIVEIGPEKIVLGSRACPFGEAVAGRPSLCLMASSACGAIAAENTGYAKVVLEKTIAQGLPECRIAIYLRPSSGAQAAIGREYRPNS